MTVGRRQCPSPQAPVILSLCDTFTFQSMQIRWYLDDYNFFTTQPASAAQGGSGWWTAGQGAGPASPFDTPFFLVRS